MRTDKYNIIKSSTVSNTKTFFEVCNRSLYVLRSCQKLSWLHKWRSSLSQAFTVINAAPACRNTRNPLWTTNVSAIYCCQKKLIGVLIKLAIYVLRDRERNRWSIKFRAGMKKVPWVIYMQNSADDLKRRLRIIDTEAIERLFYKPVEEVVKLDVARGAVDKELSLQELISLLSRRGSNRTSYNTVRKSQWLELYTLDLSTKRLNCCFERVKFLFCKTDGYKRRRRRDTTIVAEGTVSNIRIEV